MILPKFVEVGVRFGSGEKTGVFSALNISPRSWIFVRSVGLKFLKMPRLTSFTPSLRANPHRVGWRQTNAAKSL